ncbi:MAG TPA: hypothetical protein DCM32_06185 [Xanthomonadaceae bacterium]|jgi:hypothetical protein|nr:hypothetical protein [Xanthomonadaceae bacterium]
MLDLETWELLSYIVTVFGLPFAVLLFLLEQRKERDNEEEEIHQLLSSSYTDFLRLVLENADLGLMSRAPAAPLDAEQQERRLVLFGVLVSLFERAYVLAYEDGMNARQKRRWAAWEDWMREWCRREEFRAALAPLLQGEDPDFARYIAGVSDEEAARAASVSANIAPDTGLRR